VNVQIPVADVRPLLARETGRLARPSWPDPVADHEFVRSTGSIVDLRRLSRTQRPGDILGWYGERSYCDASKMVRVAGPPDTANPHLRVIHRRLFCAGVAWRFDLGITSRWSQTEAAQTVSALSSMILRQRISINDSRLALADAGSRIAADLLKNTTAISYAELNTSPSWWMTSGRPLVLIDEYVEELDSVRANVSTLRVGNRNLPTLLVQHGASNSIVQSRRLRSALWRAHQELETLRNIVRQWRSYAELFSPQRLRDYLAPQLRLLSRPRRDLLDQPSLFALVGQIDGLDGSDLLELANELRGQSKGIARSLETVATAVGTRGPTHVPPSVTHNYLLFRGGLRSYGDSFHFSERASGVFGQNSQVSDSKFNTGDYEISTALQEMLAELAKFRSKLREKNRGVVEYSMGELQTARGDPGKIRSALTKIAGIAALVGEVGVPVIEAARKLLSAMGL